MKPTIKALTVAGIYMVWNGEGWSIETPPADDDPVGELLDLLYGR